MAVTHVVESDGSCFSSWAGWALYATSRHDMTLPGVFPRTNSGVEAEITQPLFWISGQDKISTKQLL